MTCNSFSELCCLFCCPPCPGKIAAKLAFLPPEPTYAFTPDETGSKFSLTLTERAEWQYSEREKENIEGFYSRTSRGNRIACLFVRCSPNARFTILFSHGNAVDLGQMSSFYLGLGTRINCNIFSYDYSGYGVSGGKPSEKNLYADIDAAWQALRTRYGISPENIILYGQSIGTACESLFPNTKRTWFFDAFPSIDKIPKVTSPVLVIHGTEDEVIDFSHGLAIYERCPRAVEPLWVEGAGHNDVELFNQYLERLKRFVSLAGAGPSRAGPEKHVTKIDAPAASEDGPRSPRPTVPTSAAHNISISVTDADSPCVTRRRNHLRSLSDVTPAARSPVARARSHSERPRASPGPSPTPSAAPSTVPSPRRLPVPPVRTPHSPHSPRPTHTSPTLRPRAVRSERSSPDASLHMLSDEPRSRPELDPWRKMSDVDLGRAGRTGRQGRTVARRSLDAPNAPATSRPLDPWVRKARRAASRDEVCETRARRGRLERSAVVQCESCGGGGGACECWRGRETCTCSPWTSPARVPQLSSAQRALSHEEGRPRRLYKSSFQKAISISSSECESRVQDPLLETTC
ncbi:unnamed protein product [Danaus chrysippus]|uniref:(African queen) hypothetical protein n=1 Tax=Danaus chrysippus TaxID=151541 RepID=A0A8J2R5E4_9NEOP|nr:unnamed protein product [Danaus chrysippus]